MKELLKVVMTSIICDFLNTEKIRAHEKVSYSDKSQSAFFILELKGFIAKWHIDYSEVKRLPADPQSQLTFKLLKC